MRFIDSHCHLTFTPMKHALKAVLERARQRRVTDIVVPAYDPASWNDVAALKGLDGVHLALGLHPWVADAPLDLKALARRLRAIDAVALGEIGLDAKVDVSLSRQLEVLRGQLALAVEMHLPVLLHCQNAFEALLTSLDEHPRLTGVVHAFSRSPEVADRILKRGFYIAFGGTVTRPRAVRARRAARMIPADRLLIETDAPSIGLEGMPPEKTEPAHAADVAAALAALRDVPLETLASQTTKNAKRLFGIS